MKLKDVDWFRVIVILTTGALLVWLYVILGDAFGILSPL